MIFQLAMGFDSLNFSGAWEGLLASVFVFVFILVFGVLFYWLYIEMSYNIEVEIMRQVGEPFNKDDKKKINYESEYKKGKLYEKKTSAGGYKEYFKIKGSSWDYENYFPMEFFHTRKPSGILDFKKKGIKLFRDQQKGLVPISLSNPSFEQHNITLNQVIGSISNSLRERDQLYRQDFWTKYGTLITVSFLIGFFVIGMLFIIKYQEIFWDNSMRGLQSVLNTIKETASPSLE